MTEVKSYGYIISIKSCERKSSIRKVRIMSVYLAKSLTSLYYAPALPQAYQSYDCGYY